MFAEHSILVLHHSSPAHSTVHLLRENSEIKKKKKKAKAHVVEQSFVFLIHSRQHTVHVKQAAPCTSTCGCVGLDTINWLTPAIENTAPYRLSSTFFFCNTIALYWEEEMEKWV